MGEKGSAKRRTEFLRKKRNRVKAEIDLPGGKPPRGKRRRGAAIDTVPGRG
jgi:hypothetical protein